MRIAFRQRKKHGALVLCGLLLAACSSSSGSTTTDAAGPTGGSGGSGGSAPTGGAGGSTGGTSGGSGGTAPDAAPATPDAGADGGPVVDAAPVVDGPAAPDGPAGPFALTSTAFMEGGMIDVMYRCTGVNVSPPLSWGPGPAGTMSYAVSQVHGAAVHWVLWDIPVTTLSLPMGVERVAMPAVPPGSKQAKTGTDNATWFGYTGPCPGGANLDYEYAVYALPTATLDGVTTASTAKAVYDALQKGPLKKATLTGKASK